ncbi:hypothetical protein E2C01_050014 [Portunus trituberculatus]|uniref:Uncharacterized protein n=1 Tax=Portunus trituberculatus TaxID=210409 RepID=A0A5B7GHN1_PORTR|nr:hypothetical protein [Portunus trituberculatus]
MKTSLSYASIGGKEESEEEEEEKERGGSKRRSRGSYSGRGEGSSVCQGDATSLTAVLSSVGPVLPYKVSSSSSSSSSLNPVNASTS